MDLGKAIYDILSTDGTVSASVSTRIYPDTVPQQAAFPFIAYTLVSTAPTDIKDGVSPLDTISLQVDIYSQDYGVTQGLNDAVRTALDRYRGTNNGVVIDGIRFANTGAGRYDEELEVYWVSQDYDVRINRA